MASCNLAGGCGSQPYSRALLNTPALGADAWVLRGALGAEVRSWSKIYVPLIFCALGDVPECAAVACRADLYSSQYVSSGDGAGDGPHSPHASAQQ